MAKKVKTRTPGNITEIELTGTIGWWGNSSEWLRNKIKNKGDLIIKANSGGGDVIEANEMFNILQEHPHNVRIEIGALAASAMGYLALAGDEIAVHKNSVWMCHQAYGFAYGTAEDIRAEADVTAGLEGIIASTIGDAVGKTQDEALADMKAVTFLYGGEAIVNYGIATEIIDAEDEETPENTANEAASQLAVNNAMENTRQKLAENMENTRARVKNFTNFLNDTGTPEETPEEEPTLTPSNGVNHMMTPEEQKAAHDEGVAKERARVNAWHKFNGIDNDFMQKGIESGEELSMTDMAHFNRAALDTNVSATLGDEAPTEVTPAATPIPAATNSTEPVRTEAENNWLRKYQPEVK